MATLPTCQGTSWAGAGESIAFNCELALAREHGLFTYSLCRLAGSNANLHGLLSSSIGTMARRSPSSMW